VNASDPLLPVEVPPVEAPPVEVPVPLVVAVATRIPAEAVVPLVPPVATMVWLPTGVLLGIVTEVLNPPADVTEVVPSVTGVLKSWRVTASPGLNPDPLTVNEPPGGTVEALRLSNGAFGPYAYAGAAHSKAPNAIAAITTIRIILRTFERPPSDATREASLPIVPGQRVCVKPLAAFWPDVKGNRLGSMHKGDSQMLALRRPRRQLNARIHSPGH
jgi:hypothetical protein